MSTFIKDAVKKIIDIVGNLFRCNLKDLKEFQGSLKTLTKERYEKAKNNIIRNGFAAPFFVYTDEKGIHHILDGHQRHRTLLLMAEEGYELPETFPCVSIKAKTLKEAKKLILAYNSQFGEMSDESLFEFIHVSELNYSDIKTETKLPQIDEEEYEAKFYDKEETSSSEADDEVPEVKESIAKPGELWILGNHRLLCGDATNKEDVERLMNGEKAELLFTDPPYGMNAVSDAGTLGGGSGKYKKVYKKIEGDSSEFDATFLLGLDVQNRIVWGGNFLCHLYPRGTHWIVWDKRGANMQGGSDAGTQSDCELAWTDFERNSVKKYVHVWAGWFRSGNKQDELVTKVHPTQKPVGLCELILKDYPAKVVLDLFLGSGSTLIACEKTNRKCFGMEIDPHYCSVVIERWEKFTNQKAHREDGVIYGNAQKAEG